MARLLPQYTIFGHQNDISDLIEIFRAKKAAGSVTNGDHVHGFAANGEDDAKGAVQRLTKDLLRVVVFGGKPTRFGKAFQRNQFQVETSFPIVWVCRTAIGDVVIRFFYVSLSLGR